MGRYFDKDYDHYNCHNWDVDGYPGEFVYGDDVYIDDYYFDEKWKPINWGPYWDAGYWVSDKGRVWSSKTQRFLKLKHLDKHGHLGVCLSCRGGYYYVYIHRLVAMAFKPNPNKYPIVRHIYDNPNDNEYDDIEWGTMKDNTQDAIRNGHARFPTDEDREKGFEKVRRPVLATNLETGESIEFRGQQEASRFLGINQANIWKVLNGERPRAQGYKFRYLDVECDCEDD